MNRATLTRLARLETAHRHHEAMVHVVPAMTDDEFSERRAALIETGAARPDDAFLRVHGVGMNGEPFVTGMTMGELLAHIAANGRKVYNLSGVSAHD
jgi:hypothetical protein